MKLYAGWGVDFLKVDCISKPYKADEIHMIRSAIEKTGRTMVLSLSPGPTPLEQADDVAKNAQMWRISDDVWDVWSNDKADGSFPQTIQRQFNVLASWMPHQQPGRWPDADMLPIGTLGPRPGWGKPRDSRLTADETRSMLTLWAMAKSPLILGSNLLQMSPSLTAMLTNPEWLDVNQTGSHPVQLFSNDGLVTWRSNVGSSKTQHACYLAIFNLADQPKDVELSWNELGAAPGRHHLRDVWLRKELGTLDRLKVTLAAHASVLYQLR